MESKSKIDGIAATVAGVAYVLSSAFMAFSAAADDGVPGNDSSLTWAASGLVEENPDGMDWA